MATRMEGDEFSTPVTRSESESERRYREIFEATSDGLVINAPDGTILEVNPALCRMHGYTRDELIGADLTIFIHPDSHHLLAEYLAAVRAEISFQTRALDLRKDGSTFPVEVHGARCTYGGQPAMLGVVRDVSESVQAYELLEQRVAERTRELTSLLEVSRNVASTLELKLLLDTILDQLNVLVEYTGAGILALEGEEFVVLGYRGPLPQEQAMRLRFPLAHAPVHREVVRHGKPLLIADIYSDEQLARSTREEALKRNMAFPYIRSWILVPLTYRDRVIGALSVEYEQPNHYTQRHATLALAIAQQAAIAIENARLFERAQEVAALEERQRLARELHDSVSQAIYGLNLYAEAAGRMLSAGDTTSAGKYLAEIRSTAREALQEMRLLIFELRPPVLAEQGLVGALRARIESVERRTRGLTTTFTTESYERLAPEVEDALYRIAQEALNNAVKYAQAHAITLTLRQDMCATVLEVVDNGAGFDLTAVPAEGRLGLAGMRERATQVGATLTIESAPHQGTRVRAEVPR